MFRSLTLSLLLAATALLSGCAASPIAATTTPGTPKGGNTTSTPASLSSALQAAAKRFDGLTSFNVTTAAGITTATGKINGLPFVATFPEKWNKKTVLFAHGYVTPGQPETVSAAQDPSGGLGLLANAQGYAYAYSAYSKSGYAVKSGVEATQALKKFLDAAGSQAAYITGASMGGNVAVGLIEKYPGDYVGAMPFCGVTAGWAEEIRYLTDFRVIYDFLTRDTPYALPGSGDIFTPNPGFTSEAVQQKIGALFTDAGRGDARARSIIGGVSQASGAHADPYSFGTALGGSAYGLTDLLATAGGNGYSNVGVQYTTGNASVDAALNAEGTGVLRVQASPQAAVYLKEWYTPTGRFTAKVLSVHNTIDPLVPYRHAELYRQTVQKAGNSARLVQQTVQSNMNAPVHCDFKAGQVMFAWNELRAWVEQGKVPQGGLDITAKSGF